ncbi:class I SAM-dependent methyltransferase [Desulfovibrio sp. TomC]|uniref:class I SAM-dependent methyltransferase n=1 Tax=Desulfovibrio sp. TomC TaxID=1562888 RepID=UPI000573BB1E|nr:class I SAM-dependent methyltransferase [Desulfovibrio sp. TomC]KHK00295.1 putative methyltransferase [Desulfovibrio sp. TomC]
MAKHYKRTDCRLCGSSYLTKAFVLQPTPLADSYLPDADQARNLPSYPLDLYLCANCGHAQLLDVVMPEEIYLNYIYETKTSLGLRSHFEQYARDTLTSIQPAEGSFVLDIGSNDGTLLTFFRQAGHRVLGIDPAGEIARRATRKGIPTLAAFFGPDLADTIKSEHGPATIVTSNNLVANVDDLHSFVDGIRRILAKDGVFIFESFYMLDWMRNFVFDFTYHEHLSYFSVTPLKRFFAEQGMELIDVLHTQSKGGSLRYIVQMAEGGRQPSPRIAEYEILEKQHCLHQLSGLQAYEKSVHIAGEKLREYLSTIIKQGERIVGYGASATTTTLLYQFGLHEYLTFIVDENPDKIGLYAPGSGLAVYSPDRLMHDRPENVLILAWRYAEPIINKNRNYQDAGGRFIIPLPTLQFV